MTDRTYNILKWIGITFLPASLTFFGVVGATLNLGSTQTVLTIGTAFVTFYNTLIGISSVQYHKDK